MKYSKKVFVLLISASILQACAHASTEKQVEKEVAQESNVKSEADLNAVQTKAIENASGLTDEQKQKMTALRETTATQVSELRTESLKLRAALINDLVATSDKSAEIRLLKKKLKAVENKRLTTTFDAIDKANLIMGRRAQSNSVMMNEFFEVGSKRN